MFIPMAFVGGQTLRTRIEQGPFKGHRGRSGPVADLPQKPAVGRRAAGGDLRQGGSQVSCQQKIVQPGGDEMIRRVHEADPMTCPRCGFTLKVVTLLTDYASVDRIFCRLKLTFAAEKPPPSHILEPVAPLGAEEGGGFFDRYHLLKRKIEVLRPSGDFLVVRNDDLAGRPPSSSLSRRLTSIRGRNILLHDGKSRFQARRGGSSPRPRKQILIPRERHH